MQPDTLDPKPLSGDLREIRDLFRRYVGSHQRPTIDACRELYVALNVMAEKADALEARATVADELEAVARDLDLVASTHASPSLQETLKHDQRAVQAQLDGEGYFGGGFFKVDDRGLSRLSAVMTVTDHNANSAPDLPRGTAL